MKLQWVIFASALALAGAASGQETLPLRHAHGLGHSADGTRIMIPGHQGIMVHRGGRWSIAPGPERDFMGFAVTRDFIFTSGHFPPGGSRGLSLGLLRSRDGGQSWMSIGLEGGVDFHVLAAGFESNALYVYNSRRVRECRRRGCYRMASEGLGWRNANENEFAIVTFERAVFVTPDRGETWTRIARARGTLPQ